MIIEVNQLKELYRAFIKSLGGSSEEADAFAEAFVIADLRGMEWQGIKSIRKHIVFPIQQGIIQLGKSVEVVKEGPASVVLEANNELGQFVCRRAMQLAIEKAKTSGSCVVIIRNAGDTGLLGAYTLMAVEHDCIGVMFNNTNPYVAPWGGSERTLGIDPISVGIPAGEETPILMDMSITKAQDIFDTDTMWAPPFPIPNLMLFETVREYVLSTVVELMCGALTGTPIGRDKVKRGQCGVFCMALHIPHFIDMQEFRQRVDRYIQQLKSTKLADGFRSILIPGERGFREHKRRLRDGIPVPEQVWSKVTELAEEIGVNWQEAIRI